MKIENIKEEVTHDMENLRKKNEIETENTAKVHSSRLEQMEDRIQNAKIKQKLKIKLKNC
jgi:hypothetical protein